MSAILRPFLRSLAALLGLAACAPLGAADAADSVARAESNLTAAAATVVRDAFGVPHIFAERRDLLFEAYGHAVAHDRLWQLELNRRAARGTLAEILGERLLEVDRLARLTGYTDPELAAQFSALPAEVQSELQAYTRGINRYLQEAAAHLKAAPLPLELTALGLEPAPWHVHDSLAFAAMMLRRFGEVGGEELAHHALWHGLRQHLGAARADAAFADLLPCADEDAPVTLAGRAAAPQADGGGCGRPAAAQAGWPALPDPFPRPARVLPRLAGMGIPYRLGSFAWALSPAHTADGTAHLYGGPQMGFAAPEVVHEVQLHSGDGYNVVGMAFAGVPYVLIGHNADLAWTSTTAVGDNLDIFVEILCDAGQGPESGTLFHGACRRLDCRQESIAVRGAAAVPVEVCRSGHGPLQRLGGGRAVAQQRVHWQREAGALVGFRAFNLAADVGSFVAGLAPIVTQHNLIYADRQGNVGFWQAGEVPVRPAGFDPRLPLPGTGEAEWPGPTVPRPGALNPASGLIANWNNKPQAGYRSAYSRLFGPQSRLTDLTRRLHAGPLSRSGAQAVALDIARVGPEGRLDRNFLPGLLAALRRAPPQNPTVAGAWAVLRGWGGEILADARTSSWVEPGHLIMTAWLEKVSSLAFSDLPELARPFLNHNALLRHLHRGPPGGGRRLNQADLVACFEAAVLERAGHLGPDPAQWREPRAVHELRHPLFGKLASLPAANRATYAQSVWLGPAGIEAENGVPLGQSGLLQAPAGGDGMPVPAPHFDDQARLFRQFVLKPMRLLAPGEPVEGLSLGQRAAAPLLWPSGGGPARVALAPAAAAGARLLQPGQRLMR